MARRGMVRQGRHGAAWPGTARPGKTRQAKQELTPRTALTVSNFMSNRHVRNAKKFVMRHGVAVHGVKASTIGDTLTDIDRRNGHLTPKLVVDESRPENAPLHPCFEWRDEVAAEKHREWQARHLIKSVEVVYETAPGKEIQVPVFVNIPSETTSKPGEYRRIETVSMKQDLYIKAVDQLAAKVQQAQHALDTLREYCESENNEPERMARISMAVIAMKNASAAIAALH